MLYAPIMAITTRDIDKRETLRASHSEQVTVESLDYDPIASLICAAAICVAGPGEYHNLGTHVVARSVEGLTLGAVNELLEQHLKDVGLSALTTDHIS